MEEDKIIFFLSFIGERIVRLWKNALIEEAYSTGTNGTEIEFETFTMFVKKFKKAFEPLSPI